MWKKTMEGNNNSNNNNNNNKIVVKSWRSGKRCVRWLWERGVRLGKNAIMAAVVVSSAPLVLPPLMAISAVGFVVWVPAGVVVAGYAAVEKLMTTLLPLPLQVSCSAPDDGRSHLYAGIRNEEEDIVLADDDDDHKGYDEKDFDEERSEFVDRGGEEGFAIDEDLTEGAGEYLKREDEEGKYVISEYGNLEKNAHEDDGEKCIQGEEGEAIENTCVSLKEEYNVEGISKNLEGECADDKCLSLEGSEEIPFDGEYLEDKNKIINNAHSYIKEEVAVMEQIEVEQEPHCDYGSFECNSTVSLLTQKDEPNKREEEDLKNVSNPFESRPKYASDGMDSECGIDYTCTISAEEENAGEQEDSLGSQASGRSNDAKTKESAEEPSTEVMAMMSEEKIWVDIDDDQSLERDLIVKGVTEKDINEEHCESADGEGKVIAIDENLEEESYVMWRKKNLDGEGEEVTIDENLRKRRYAEELGEYLKGEEEENENENLDEKKGCAEEKCFINVCENLGKKGYEDKDVGDYLEGECEEENDSIHAYENSERKGYEEDSGKCIEGEQGDTKGVTPCVSLKAEYNVDDISKNLEGEQRGFEEISIGGDLIEGEGYMEEVDDHLDREDEEYSEAGAQGDQKEIGVDEGLEEEQGGATIDWSLKDPIFEWNDFSLLQKDEPNKNEEEDAKMDISVVDDANAHATEENVTETERQQSVGEDLKNDSTPLGSGQKHASDGMDSESSSIYDYTFTLCSMEEGEVGEQKDSLGSHTLESSRSIKIKESAEPSNEVVGIMSEEMIWEQVGAIRAILGYTDAKQSSIVDEIKALFVFIGVEPPSPFHDPSHLTDVYEKLKILMSIVGTK